MLILRRLVLQEVKVVFFNLLLKKTYNLLVLVQYSYLKVTLLFLNVFLIEADAEGYLNFSVYEAFYFIGNFDLHNVSQE